MSKEKKTIEQIRAEGIAENEKYIADKKPKVVEGLNATIEVIKNNQDHIAGFCIVLIPYENTVLVDQDGDSVNGFSYAVALHQAYKAVLDARVKDSLEPKNPMAALFGR